MSTPIVLITEELSPAGIAVLESGFEIRHADGADREQLLAALADADAVIIRSATVIDAEALEHLANAEWSRRTARADGLGLNEVRRLDRKGAGGKIMTIYRQYGYKTEVLAASLRHPMHVVEAAKMGAHIGTMPFKLFEMLFKHPLTDAGLATLLKDWAAAKRRFS